jgi:6-phosphogluconolactonase
MTASAEPSVEILADPEALARHAADWLLAAARAKEGLFAICLSGGATPRRLYELLAAPPRRGAFPWSRTHWFWGDERFVPHDAPESNYRMVRDAMLAHAPIPDANIHPIPTAGLAPATAAADYERALQDFYGASALAPERPLFDVVLLGLGPDGHTASLFPGAAILEERKRWVGAVLGVKPEPRITLTFPALESGCDAAFLIAGEGKRAVLERLFRGERVLPAARLHPRGRLHFFLDCAAAPRRPP